MWIISINICLLKIKTKKFKNIKYISNKPIICLNNIFYETIILHSKTKISEKNITVLHFWKFILIAGFSYLLLIQFLEVSHYI